MPTITTSERPPMVEQLRAESRGLRYRPAKRRYSERCRPSPEDIRRLFTVEKGNRWLELARREPEAKMLLGELWHQGELCMLFADTNIGKSVLAVQIGESIARGQSIAPFACQTEPARVLYLDFELSQRQFGLRYSKGEDDYLFSDNFYRAQFNFIPDPPPNVDENELLIAGIESKINLAKANVLIIDNITCLRGGTENSTVALSIMKSLKALKTEHQLSILVLAHTPKRRNATQPISADDLHGSKLLINFADSAFAIGKSTADTDLCYLKQIKQRNTRQRYGEDNVCLCRMQKPGAFLHFAFEGNSAERLHLLTRTAVERQHLAGEVAALSAEGFSQREISGQLGIGLATVNKLLRRECADGEGCADVRVRECADEEKYAEDGCVEDLAACHFNPTPSPALTDFPLPGKAAKSKPEVPYPAGVTAVSDGLRPSRKERAATHHFNPTPCPALTDFPLPGKAAKSKPEVPYPAGVTAVSDGHRPSLKERAATHHFNPTPCPALTDFPLPGKAAKSKPEIPYPAGVTAVSDGHRPSRKDRVATHHFNPTPCPALTDFPLPDKAAKSKPEIPYPAGVTSVSDGHRPSRKAGQKPLIEKSLTEYVPPPPPIGNIQTEALPIKPDPTGIFTTSMIDMQLTPELLEKIKRTIAKKNILKRGID